MDYTKQPVRRTDVLRILPMSKPRMTIADKWKKRPVVLRYREFKDRLRDECQRIGLTEFPEAHSHVTFFIPMPKSWSKRKKTMMLNESHKQRPDVDNLLKGLLDGIYETEDDCIVWDIHITKIWTDEGSGRIEILHGI